MRDLRAYQCKYTISHFDDITCWHVTSCMQVRPLCRCFTAKAENQDVKIMVMAFLRGTINGVSINP
jgi:hypothetical protein